MRGGRGDLGEWKGKGKGKGRKVEGELNIRVETECAGGRESREEAWKADGEDGGPEEAGRDGPAHADLW